MHVHARKHSCTRVHTHARGPARHTPRRYKWDLIRSVIKSFTGLQNSKVAELERSAAAAAAAARESGEKSTGLENLMWVYSCVGYGSLMTHVQSLLRQYGDVLGAHTNTALRCPRRSTDPEALLAGEAGLHSLTSKAGALTGHVKEGVKTAAHWLTGGVWGSGGGGGSGPSGASARRSRCCVQLTLVAWWPQLAAC